MSDTILRVGYTLESAHRLLGYKGKCSRLHGHNYRVTLVLARDLSVVPEKEAELAAGFVMDTANVDTCVRPVLQRLDHRAILAANDPLVPLLQQDSPDHVFVLDLGLPTAENLAHYLFDRLAFLSHSGRQRLVRVEVQENPDTIAEYPA